jgi:L-seryl-tRNA(Ser) seleniumtransferase
MAVYPAGPQASVGQASATILRAPVSASPYPSVDALVRAAGCDAPHAVVVEAARSAIADRRATGQPATVDDLREAVRERVRRSERPSLRRVLNATGVVLHTNLGRAPLAAAAVEAIADTAQGYANLELDLDAGRRGSRQAHLEPLLCALTGARAALCVNNGAAAVLLALAALAAGREVVVSRGELVEIGDGFRIPEVLEQSGARLREVGTTNRTRLQDYERAIGEHTAALLRVHPSNYRVVGFTERVELPALAELARSRGLALIEDLGSGALTSAGPLAGEPTVREALAGGADLVTFSGDKLLGGPQAGLLVGSAEAVDACRRHPLARALRLDRLSVAALEATLRLYHDPERALREIPALRMACEPAETVRARAERLAARLDGRVVETLGRIGGGALPLAELPSFGVALDGPADELAAALRQAEPPVVARVVDGACVLDCRTLRDDELELVSVLNA